MVKAKEIRQRSLERVQEVVHASLVASRQSEQCKGTVLLRCRDITLLSELRIILLAVNV